MMSPWLVLSAVGVMASPETPAGGETRAKVSAEVPSTIGLTAVSLKAPFAFVVPLVTTTCVPVVHCELLFASIVCIPDNVMFAPVVATRTGALMARSGFGLVPIGGSAADTVAPRRSRVAIEYLLHSGIGRQVSGKRAHFLTPDS